MASTPPRELEPPRGSAIDNATVAALRAWRTTQDREREFFGADYHPSGYVFTFEDGRPRGRPMSVRPPADPRYVVMSVAVSITETLSPLLLVT